MQVLNIFSCIFLPIPVVCMCRRKPYPTKYQYQNNHVVYHFDNDNDIDINNADAIVAVTWNKSFAIDKKGKYAVTALSRVNQESEPVVITVK